MQSAYTLRIKKVKIIIIINSLAKAAKVPLAVKDLNVKSVGGKSTSSSLIKRLNMRICQCQAVEVNHGYFAGLLL